MKQFTGRVPSTQLQFPSRLMIPHALAARRFLLPIAFVTSSLPKTVEHIIALLQILHEHSSRLCPISLQGSIHDERIGSTTCIPLPRLAPTLACFYRVAPCGTGEWGDWPFTDLSCDGYPLKYETTTLCAGVFETCARALSQGSIRRIGALSSGSVCTLAFLAAIPALGKATSLVESTRTWEERLRLLVSRSGR